MPIYHQLGTIPHKRHTVFEKASGGIHYEQLFGTEGFHGMSSLLYHVHRPTMIKSIGTPIDVSPVAAVNKNITPLMLQGWNVPAQDDFLKSRVHMLFNNDLNITLAAPRLISMTMSGVAETVVGAGNGIGMNSDTGATGAVSVDSIAN